MNRRTAKRLGLAVIAELTDNTDRRARPTSCGESFSDAEGPHGPWPTGRSSAASSCSARPARVEPATTSGSSRL